LRAQANHTSARDLLSAMDRKVEAFYDAFSSVFIRDYVEGNKRIERQFKFFRAAIEPETPNILIIGCGSGQSAHFIATRTARKARIRGIDISSANIGLAKALFAHPNIEYQNGDVLSELIQGQWNLVLLPDVYEHIPREARTELHAKLNQLLTPNGRILITVPTPQAQASVVALGGALQVIDEPVTLHDLMTLASDVQGALTYFASVSIWQSNDYIHAIIERQAEQCRPLRRLDHLPIKSYYRRNGAVQWLRRRIGLPKLGKWWRARQASRRLKGLKFEP